MGITAETCLRYGVRHIAKMNGDVPVLDGTGQPVGSGSLFFPLHDYTTYGLIGYVKRDWGKSKKDGMRTFADPDRVAVFGLNTISEYKKRIIICEGISDTLTVGQELGDRSTTVVGILGTEHGVIKGIPRILPLLYEFDEIYLCFDPDEAGQQALDELLPKMPVGRTYIVTLPAGTDPNELLKTNQVALLQGCFKKARRYLPDYVVGVDELVDNTLSYFYDEEKRVGITTGYPELDKIVGGYAPGKMIMLCAPPKNGKTAFLLNLAYNAYKLGLKQLFFALEMSFQEVVLGIASIELGVYLKDSTTRPEDIDRDVLETLIRDIADSITFIRDFGAMSTDELRDKCHLGVDAFGARLIWLDHITAASVGMDTKQVDEMCYMLKCVAKDKGITMVVVSHVNTVKEFHKVTYGDLRNSRALTQVPDVTLGIMRRKEKGTTLVYTVTPDRFQQNPDASPEFILYYKAGRFTDVKPTKRSDQSAGGVYATDHQLKAIRQVSQSAREALPQSSPNVPAPSDDSTVHILSTGVRDTDGYAAVAQPYELAIKDGRGTHSPEYAPVHSRLLRPEEWDILRDKGEVTTRGGSQVYSGIKATQVTVSNGLVFAPYSLWKDEDDSG